MHLILFWRLIQKLWFFIQRNTRSIQTKIHGIIFTCYSKYIYAKPSRRCGGSGHPSEYRIVEILLEVLRTVIARLKIIQLYSFYRMPTNCSWVKIGARFHSHGSEGSRGSNSLFNFSYGKLLTNYHTVQEIILCVWEIVPNG